MNDYRIRRTAEIEYVPTNDFPFPQTKLVNIPEDIYNYLYLPEIKPYLGGYSFLIITNSIEKDRRLITTPAKIKSIKLIKDYLTDIRNNGLDTIVNILIRPSLIFNEKSASKAPSYYEKSYSHLLNNGHKYDLFIGSLDSVEGSIRKKDNMGKEKKHILCVKFLPEQSNSNVYNYFISDELRQYIQAFQNRELFFNDFTSFGPYDSEISFLIENENGYKYRDSRVKIEEIIDIKTTYEPKSKPTLEIIDMTPCIIRTGEDIPIRLPTKSFKFWLESRASQNLKTLFQLEKREEEKKDNPNEFLANTRPLTLDCHDIKISDNNSWSLDHIKPISSATSVDKKKTNTKRSKSNMKNSLFTNLQFGTYTNDMVGISINGLAFKDNSGKFFSYDKKEDRFVDMSDFLIDIPNALYKMPVELSKIAEGDIILNKGLVFIVEKKDEKRITGISPYTKEERVIFPEHNILNFDYVTKIVNIFEPMLGTMSLQNGDMSSLLPLLMFSDSDGIDTKTILMMSMMSQKDGDNTNGIMSNPLMLMALMGDDNKNSSMKDMLPLLMMSNGGFNLFGTSSTDTTAKA